MIVGRKDEQKRLERVFASKQAEFITIYGRRRVGKTFLIREFFSNKKCIFFHVTGIKDEPTKVQLGKFSEAFSETFLKKIPMQAPKNWDQAFTRLTTQISDLEEKVVIFLDELPWLATPRSDLLAQLDYVWNKHWSANPKVILVACGSSASWLIERIIFNEGGLHNRTTCEIELSPLNLFETDEYLKSRQVHLNQNHTLSLYMSIGGIPYYLNYVEPGLTAEQNIQNLFFAKKAYLKLEFQKLFDSLFNSADAYKELIALIAGKKNGISRSELAEKALLSKSGGGRLTERLEALKVTGFIQSFKPWGKERDTYYILIDEFCLFYQHWIASREDAFPRNYWITQSQKPAYHAWAGYAFEAVCRKHIDDIVSALGIHSAMSISSWLYVPQKKSREKGAQIDLVIDRSDNAINLCEIKYTDQPFALDKQCAEKLQYAETLFKEKTQTNKQIFLSLISANGIKKTMYSEELIHGVVTLHDLFKPV